MHVTKGRTVTLSTMAETTWQERTEGLARVEPWHCDRNVRCRWSRDTSLGEVKFRLVLSANTTRSVMDHKCRSHLTETESMTGIVKEIVTVEKDTGVIEMAIASETEIEMRETTGIADASVVKTVMILWRVVMVTIE